jgi:hypothetical protein
MAIKKANENTTAEMATIGPSLLPIRRHCQRQKRHLFNVDLGSKKEDQSFFF